jgi:hypothetical protein
VTALQLPFMPVNQACHDLVREHSPQLWEAFSELVGVAQSDGDPVERARTIRERSGREWERFADADTEGLGRTLARAWPCCTEDLVAALVVQDAIPGGGDRLEALLALLQSDHDRDPSIATTSAILELKQAIG